jgi:hypothetical protein
MASESSLTEVVEILLQNGFSLANALIEEINQEKETDDKIILPETWRILRNEYALLLLCPFDQQDTLKKKAEDILELFHYILIFFENKKGHLLDGYALLVMDNEPKDKETLGVISEIHINRRVCRMQVIWPALGEENPWNERLQYLPIYTLPQVSSVQNAAEPPTSYGPYALHVRTLLEKMTLTKASIAVKEHPYVNQ